MLDAAHASGERLRADIRGMGDQAVRRNGEARPQSSSVRTPPRAPLWQSSAESTYAACAARTARQICSTRCCASGTSSVGEGHAAGLTRRDRSAVEDAVSVVVFAAMALLPLGEAAARIIDGSRHSGHRSCWSST